MTRDASPTCPRDHYPLVRVKEEGGVSWLCPACGGVFATLPRLRRFLAHAAVNRLWQNARTGEAGDLACPACGVPMAHLKGGEDEASPWLDVCRGCQAVWFDRRELDALPRRLPDLHPAPEPLPQKAREKIALMKVREMEERNWEDGGETPGGWKLVPFVLGLPVRMGAPASRPPLVTLALTVLILTLGVVGLVHTDLIWRFGLVPGCLGGLRCLTFLTSLFLHGGVVHLAVNLYFLLLFGSLAEDALGWRRYLALYALAGVLGGWAHVLLDPRDSIPAIGASGCISGVMAYAALAAPATTIWVRLRFFVGRFPAWLFFLLWLVFQLVGLYSQSLGVGETSAAAHVAGSIVGVVFYFACGKPRWAASHDLDG